MANDKIKRAGELIDEGKYAQARKLLKGVNDPRAKRLLEEIDDLQPPKSGGGGLRDFLQVLLMGMLFTALFGGAGFVIANSIGIPKAAVVEDDRPLAAVTPGAQDVAVQPTVEPTPTEIPCEAQAWWDTNRVALGEAVNTILNANIQTPPSQINSAKNAFAGWRTTFEGETAAPCVQAARSAISNAIPQVEAVFDSYLTPTTDQQRAQTFIRAMDELLLSADAITQLPITTTDDTWLVAVQDFTRGDCPAKRWFTEIIQGRDYKRFFDLFNTLDFGQIAAATSTLREMQGLRGAFAADSATFPDCVKTASDHLLASMNGFIAYGNARLGGDMSNVDPQLQTGNNELTSFYTELARIEPTLSGVRLK